MTVACWYSAKEGVQLHLPRDTDIIVELAILPLICRDQQEASGSVDSRMGVAISSCQIGGVADLHRLAPMLTELSIYGRYLPPRIFAKAAQSHLRFAIAGSVKGNCYRLVRCHSR